jgi:hypothetical protein
MTDTAETLERIDLTRYAGADGRLDTRILLGSFETDLWMPRICAGKIGRWSMRVIATHGTRGYWGTLYNTSGAALLLGPGTGKSTSWMTTTPWEIESQEIGIRAARGHTVVLGLGMGWQTANVALNPAVESVTVVEHDSDVLALSEAQDIFAQLPPETREKIKLTEGDAHTFKPERTVDTLLADIWEHTDGPDRIGEMRRIQDNIAAEAVYFWGQEMQIWHAARARQGESPTLDWPLVRTIAAGLALPLILPDWPDYPQKIAAVGHWWGSRTT